MYLISYVFAINKCIVLFKYVLINVILVKH